MLRFFLLCPGRSAGELEKVERKGEDSNDLEVFDDNLALHPSYRRQPLAKVQTTQVKP